MIIATHIATSKIDGYKTLAVLHNGIMKDAHGNVFIESQWEFKIISEHPDDIMNMQALLDLQDLVDQANEEQDRPLQDKAFQPLTSWIAPSHKED